VSDALLDLARVTVATGDAAAARAAAGEALERSRNRRAAALAAQATAILARVP
jgi:alkylation response protein AidB-like acyl-CoA dehydrogenase